VASLPPAYTTKSANLDYTVDRCSVVLKNGQKSFVL
jgi:hypothetical protein